MCCCCCCCCCQVMVYASWPARLYISTSTNATEWESPRLLLEPEHGIAARYPTIIGPHGDLVSGGDKKMHTLPSSCQCITERMCRAISLPCCGGDRGRSRNCSGSPAMQAWTQAVWKASIISLGMCVINGLVNWPASSGCSKPNFFCSC